MISNHIIQCILWKTETLKDKSAKSHFFSDWQIWSPSRAAWRAVPEVSPESPGSQWLRSVELVWAGDMQGCFSAQAYTPPHLMGHSPGVPCVQRINVHLSPVPLGVLWSLTDCCVKAVSPLLSREASWGSHEGFQCWALPRLIWRLSHTVLDPLRFFGPRYLNPEFGKKLLFVLLSYSM